MPYRSTEIKSYFGPASKFRHGEWYIGCQMYVVTGRAANGQLKMESGKFHMAAAAFPAQGCRAGENVAALTAQPLAALPPYGCGVPLAGRERHAGYKFGGTIADRTGFQICHCEERSDVAISGRQLRFRREYPVIRLGTARLHPKGTSSRFALRAPRRLRLLAMTIRESSLF